MLEQQPTSSLVLSLLTLADTVTPFSLLVQSKGIQGES